MTACIFLLKARHNYREQAPIADSLHRVRVEVVLPSSLEPKQYERLVKAHPKVLDVEAGK